MLADFKRTGEQKRAGGERDLSSSRQRYEDADDLGRQVVAGAIFDFVDLDRLRRE